MKSKNKYFKKVLVKRLIQLVLMFLVINFIIFFSRIGYGKGELNQDDEGGWYVYVYGPPVVGFNRVYIDNPEMFSDILRPQNLGMEVFYVYSPPNYLSPLWGPRSWDFIIIMNYNVFNILYPLISLLILSTICSTLIHIINNRKKYLIVSKL
jgi:hypothetical protein